MISTGSAQITCNCWKQNGSTGVPSGSHCGPLPQINQLTDRRAELSRMLRHGATSEGNRFLWLALFHLPDACVAGGSMFFWEVSIWSLSRRRKGRLKSSGFSRNQQCRVDFELEHVGGGAAAVAAFALEGDAADAEAALRGDGDVSVAEEVEHVVD